MAVRAASVDSSAFASARVAPGRSRASTVNWRAVRGQSEGLAARGSQRVRPDQQQLRGHHADDHGRLAVDPDGATDDGRVAPEAAVPGAMADDRRAWAARREFLARESPSHHRRHAQCRERVAQDERREHALRHVAARDVAVAEVEGHDVFQRPQRGDIEGLERRDGLDETLAVADPRKRRADADKAVRVRVGERLEDEAVDETADQAGAADAERQRQDGRPGHAGPMDEEAKRLTKILQHDVHLSAGAGWERVDVRARIADESPARAAARGAAAAPSRRRRKAVSRHSRTAPSLPR